MPKLTHKSLAALKKKAWSLMSIYVRSKDADWRGFNNCYTCGITKHWKELQAGHYIHNKLDFNSDNLKPQCARCNKWLSGNLDHYAEHLLADYGTEWLKQLRQSANTKGNNYNILEVQVIIADLTEKLKDL